MSFKLPHSLGYTKQPEDGLKWAETCSCGIYLHFVHKLFCVLTANYKLYLFIEHDGDVTLKSSSLVILKDKIMSAVPF